MRALRWPPPRLASTQGGVVWRGDSALDEWETGPQMTQKGGMTQRWVA